MYIGHCKTRQIARPRQNITYLKTVQVHTIDCTTKFSLKFKLHAGSHVWRCSNPLKRNKVQSGSRFVRIRSLTLPASNSNLASLALERQNKRFPYLKPRKYSFNREPRQSRSHTSMSLTFCFNRHVREDSAYEYSTTRVLASLNYGRPCDECVSFIMNEGILVYWTS